jgi:hypothetical protein
MDAASGNPRTLAEYAAPAAAGSKRIASPNPKDQLGCIAVIDGTVWTVGDCDGRVAPRTLIARACSAPPADDVAPMRQH